MRKLTSFLFISVDGVVEAPHRFVRGDVFDDLTSLIGETISEQDSVLLGRCMYEEWSEYWPGATIEPFASFINNTPKFVVSKTLKTLEWQHSTLLTGDLKVEIAGLKNRPGKAIGVHGSLSLVQSLLAAGLLDEMRFVLFPAVAGVGRRLLSQDGEPIQLNLQSARATPSGLQYVVYTPR
jgi:dihydrofolate reductase